MIQQFEQALEEKGYIRLKSKPEWVHTFVLPEEDETRAERARRAVICIDYGPGYSMSVHQVPLVRSKIRDYFGMPIDQDRILVVVFTRDPERARPLSMENPYCWIVDERDEKLILYENQPSDFDGMRAIAEEIRRKDLGQEAQEPPRRDDYNGYHFQRRKSGWNLKEELQWLFLGRKKHFVTVFLVLANCLAFGILSLWGDLGQSRYMIRVGGMYAPAILENGQWWRLLTCIFLHFDISHLFHNMLILYFLGKWVEEALGSARYAAVYLGSGILGAILSLWGSLSSGEAYVSAGASGAIYGLMGALAVIILVHRGRYRGLSLQRMAFMILLCIYQSVSSIGVDNMGHMGGLLSGAALTLLLYGISCLAGWETQE